MNYWENIRGFSFKSKGIFDSSNPNDDVITNGIVKRLE